MMKVQFQNIFRKLREKLFSPTPPFPHSPILLLFFLFSLLILSCTDPFPEKIDYNEGSGVFICNEGNMTFGNASLSFYDPMLEIVKNQVFYNTNEFPVGDVLQSMTIIDSLGYLMINNSGKIFVLNTSTMLHVATIPGLTSPRYMLPVNKNTAYISDLYSDHITIFDPHTYKITGTIDLYNSSEEMMLFEGFAYVCSWSFNNKVYKIETTSHTVSDSIEVAMQPNSIVLDKNDKIWVLSDGGYPGMPGSESPALSCIDPETFTISKVFVLPYALSSPTELTINPAGDTLYYINNTSEDTRILNGVYAHSIGADVLSTDPLIPSSGRLFYGLGCDPKTGAIYVSDAIDHIQKGWIFRYTSGGSILDSSKVDIIPGEFCFKPE
ncbi:DUF5074 domain-containing protein [Bacteroidota bacterium]